MSDRPFIKNQQEPPIQLKRGRGRPRATYEYQLIGYLEQRASDEFNMLGLEGWRFVGVERGGKAVFERVRKSAG